MVNSEQQPAGTGSALLAAFIEKNGLTLRRAAAEIGVSKTSLLFWVRGEQRPAFPLRAAVAKWTRGEVPASAWATPDEAEAVRRVKPFRKAQP